MACLLGFERRIGRAWGCLSFFATPRVVHGADDGLPAVFNVHMLNDDALLAAAPKPGESFHLRWDDADFDEDRALYVRNRLRRELLPRLRWHFCCTPGP